MNRKAHSTFGLMCLASIRRVLSSLAMLSGLVVAYGLQAWHEYALHHHHEHCCEGNDSLPASEEEDCQLCDFIFFFDLPEEGLQAMQIPALRRNALIETPGDSLHGRDAGPSFLRGPPHA